MKMILLILVFRVLADPGRNKYGGSAQLFSSALREGTEEGAG
jgi:hypothetical protein